MLFRSNSNLIYTRKYLPTCVACDCTAINSVTEYESRKYACRSTKEQLLFDFFPVNYKRTRLFVAVLQRVLYRSIDISEQYLSARKYRMKFCISLKSRLHSTFLSSIRLCLSIFSVESVAILICWRCQSLLFWRKLTLRFAPFCTFVIRQRSV